MWDCGVKALIPWGVMGCPNSHKRGQDYPTFPTTVVPTCCMHLRARTKDVAVLDMSLLVGICSKVGMCGSVGIQPIPHGGETGTPHSHAEGLGHPTFPTTMVPTCCMHLRARTKDVAVLDMSLLVGICSKVGMCGSVGIQPIPHGGETGTPHSHAEGLGHPTFPMTVVPTCCMHWRASQRM